MRCFSDTEPELGQARSVDHAKPFVFRRTGDHLHYSDGAVRSLQELQLVITVDFSIVVTDHPETP